MAVMRIVYRQKPPCRLTSLDVVWRGLWGGGTQTNIERWLLFTYCATKPLYIHTHIRFTDRFDPLRPAAVVRLFPQQTLRPVTAFFRIITVRTRFVPLSLYIFLYIFGNEILLWIENKNKIYV